MSSFTSVLGTPIPIFLTTDMLVLPGNTLVGGVGRTLTPEGRCSFDSNRFFSFLRQSFGAAGKGYTVLA